MNKGEFCCIKFVSLPVGTFILCLIWRVNLWVQE